jgi:hypothetical protein
LVLPLGDGVFIPVVQKLIGKPRQGIPKVFFCRLDDRSCHHIHLQALGVLDDLLAVPDCPVIDMVVVVNDPVSLWRYSFY